MFVKPTPPQNPPYTYKLKASTPDSRDYAFKTASIEQRQKVDLREFASPIKTQGPLGSCSAHSVTSAYENLVRRKYPAYFTQLSRLYLYYHSRLIEYTVSEDSGVETLRSDMQALAKYGISAEEFWPYDIEKFKEQPSPHAYADAPKRTVIGYAMLTDNDQTISALNDNYPVVVGLNVFSGFENLTKDNSMLTMPSAGQAPEGGHSITLVGYSIPDQVFYAQNSFGKYWGDNGYCTIPFAYAKEHVFDRWMFDINDQQITYVG